MARDESRELDAAIARGRADEEELSGLLNVATTLERSLDADAPRARTERAFFVSGVAARKRTGPSLGRLALPGLAVAGVLLALASLSRSTLPGDPLYTVRRVLQGTGVTRTPVEDVDRLLHSAERSIERAESLENSDPAASRRAASDALADLGEAEWIAREVGAHERLEQVADLREEAHDVLRDAAEEIRKGSGSDDSGSDDRSGSGGDDSSGSGGGGDDSSGSGGGDDSSGTGGGGDDSSGSGGGDDSSGTGGGSDGSGSGGGDDSSGSGGGDHSGSGSGGDDRSGTGGGDGSGGGGDDSSGTGGDD